MKALILPIGLALLFIGTLMALMYTTVPYLTNGYTQPVASTYQSLIDQRTPRPAGAAGFQIRSLFL